jgi:ABC-type antimicrobial peptide transport system permease subunit
VSSGHFFSRTSAAHEAILDLSYARRKNLGVGDTVRIDGKAFRIVGLARTPLGGQSSDVYLELSRLQQLSGRRGRVNTVYVRATSASAVDSVSREIKAAVPGASVTTAKDLADRVSGSLVDAKNLAGKLGLALEIVGLVAAFLIAGLLTLGAVAKRTRELGTLKAVGWSQRLVVRQVTAESVVQGLLGGALGIALGLLGAEVISALAPSLTATVANAVQAAPVPGPFGQGQAAPASTTVHLDAPVSLGLLGLAVLLAVAGGLLAGAAGGLRAARLRPAEALRHIE